MQKFNLHTHTFRCGHASGTDDQMVLSAIEAGFELLGFSDHMPYPQLHLPTCRMFWDQRQEYTDAMQALKIKYQDLIQLRFGYEAEYLDDQQALLEQLHGEVDYLILGQHFKAIETNPVYELVYDYDAYNNDEDVLFYAAQIEKAAATGWFAMIAHPDYFMLGRRTFTPACAEAARRICAVSIKRQIPLEINLNGVHYGKHNYQIRSVSPTQQISSYAYPFRPFWEIAAQMQCPVCYGWDAHAPLVLQDFSRLEIAKQILEDLPLNFIGQAPIQ